MSSLSSDGTYGITGIPLPKMDIKTKKIPYVPNMPVRKEITDFADCQTEDDKKQWTLFVLAMERFKAMPVDDKLSYFQVAGIHCYPETAWDNAMPPPPKIHYPDEKEKEKHPGAPPFGGYCSHNSLTFPTWHRPYMLLFEVSSLSLIPPLSLLLFVPYRKSGDSDNCTNYSNESGK